MTRFPRQPFGGHDLRRSKFGKKVQGLYHESCTKLKKVPSSVLKKVELCATKSRTLY
jgi:hypothetical protein